MRRRWFSVLRKPELAELRAQLAAAELRAAVAEARAEERGRALDDLRLSMRALTAGPSHREPEPDPSPTTAPSTTPQPDPAAASTGNDPNPNTPRARLGDRWRAWRKR
jgi:hypothetical protein